MTCRDIVKKYLEENGFDGLQYEQECGCELSDLMPCGDNVIGCTPGYKHSGNDDFDFLICPEPMKGEEP